jgi:hypothetical protein
MLLRRLITPLLAISIIAGLAFAPLAVPAAAKALAAADRVDHVAGMSSMSADMPCCPDEQNSKDCQDCPLIAICMLKTIQAGPSLAAAMPVRHAIRTTHSVRDDVFADGLDRPPPDHPPRNLI